MSADELSSAEKDDAAANVVVKEKKEIAKAAAESIIQLSEAVSTNIVLVQEK